MILWVDWAQESHSSLWMAHAIAIWRWLKLRASKNLSTHVSGTWLGKIKWQEVLLGLRSSFISIWSYTTVSPCSFTAAELPTWWWDSQSKYPKRDQQKPPRRPSLTCSWKSPSITSNVCHLLTLSKRLPFSRVGDTVSALSKNLPTCF